MTYVIGQIIPPSDRRVADPFGPHCTPAWYCILPKPTTKQHVEGRQFFRSHNMHSFFPSEEQQRGKPKDRRAVEVAIMPGYLFTQILRWPNWDVIRREDWCSGVFKIGETPVVFPYPIIRHLQGMTVEAEKLRRAQDELSLQMIEAARPQAGKPARFMSGPLQGVVVDVESVRETVAYFLMGDKRISADVASMARVPYLTDRPT